MTPVLRLLAAMSAGLPLIFADCAHADDSAAYTNFLNDPSLRQNIINAAARSTVMLQNPCAEAEYRVGTSPLVFKPMAFDSSGGPVAGLLKYPVKEDGCGVTRSLNVFVVVQGPRQVGAIPFLPGSTRADPTLQKDAVQYAAGWAVALVGKNEECKVKYFADTEFVEQETPAPDAKAPAWRERWTMIQCNKKLTIPLRFIPDATGTQIAAGGPGGGVEDLK